MSEFTLKNTSIVYLVKGNSPSMFKEQYLRHYKIFSEKYKVEDTVLLPPVSQIKFSDGYSFEAIDNRIKVERGFKDEIKLVEEDFIDINSVDNLSKSSKNIVSSAPYLDYYALGINFKLTVTGFNLKSLTNEVLNDYKTSTLKISKSINDHKLNLTFNLLSEEKSIVEANFHHDLSNIPEDGIVDVLSEMIDKRQELFKYYFQALNEIT